MTHYKITVTGKVQGVYFRKFTERKANELGLKGVVKNMANGSVYIEAEGEENVLKAFVKWCHEGSPYSKVDSVDVAEASAKNYTQFSIA
jgi:acylphosphatase